MTFKYGLGQEFIEVLRTLHKLGLDSTEPVSVRGAAGRPARRRRRRAARPGDARRAHERAHLRRHLGDRAPAWTGSERSTYLYHVVDNETTMREYGSQAVVWQTAVNPVVALELLNEGVWQGTGVLGPEAFPPAPFLERLAELGSPHGVMEVAEARRARAAHILRARRVATCACGQPSHGRCARGIGTVARRPRRPSRRVVSAVSP